jgi:hypothetical protein
MSEPKPKKMVRRSVAIALGIICIVLIVALVGAVAYYTMNTTSNTTYNDYVSTHSHTNADYDAMSAPELISVDLGATLIQSGYFLAKWLNVTGYVVNIHNNSAFNCTLHVVAYQSGGVTAIDTYIGLGTIAGESYYKVNANAFYGANANYTEGITSYTITPQWTASP